MEFLPDEPGHERRGNVDDEIIDRAVLLQKMTGRPTAVVTIDRNMRLRAHVSGLKVWSVPDKLIVPSVRPAT
ncbi:PIN domain-containing protein [Actinomadura scrupuli]|uniref:PIN domain-containing protein n=1 Tax=Actinomadura scrupuli TaxID=559629 RepID=UPI003D951F6E